MKEQDGRDFWKGALERWNRLPSEEGVMTVVRGADRKGLALRREGDVWHVVKPSEVGRGERVIEVDLPTKAILPAFANAHTHLDLTHVGPREYDHTDPRGFVSWIEMVRRERVFEPDAIRASVRLGIEKSLLGGVVAVGDIAGAMRTEPVEELRASPLAGTSFVEFFGLGERQQAAVDAMHALVERYPVIADGVRVGLQPHAMYSAGPKVYDAAQKIHASHRVGLSTHLSETPEEWALITGRRGPLVDFLRSLGVEWSEPISTSPVNRFGTVGRVGPWVIAHANALGDHDPFMLMIACRSVAYCPRAHGYFRHQLTLGPHPWLRILESGGRVCIATDSIINIPPAQADRISPLDDARRVFREMRLWKPAEDRLFASYLIRMITSEGAKALTMNQGLFNLRPGPILGLVAVEVEEGIISRRLPMVAALESDAPPELIALSDKREAPLFPQRPRKAKQ